MKKLLFIMLSCILFIGCDKEEKRDGIGDDPKLNVEEYIFPKEGGSLEVYSTLGYSLLVTKATEDSGEKEGNSFIGKWFKITWDANWKKLLIEVEPNETGYERKLPVDISSGNFRCPTNYIQKAE